MTRFNDWENRLVVYLRSVYKTPFKWGTHDCFTFTGQCVNAMTGYDFSEPYIGKYDSAETATKLANEEGFKTHLNYVASKFKRHKSAFQMMRGDVVLIKDLSGELVLGICQGSRIYLAGDTGVYTLCASKVLKAFAV